MGATETVDEILINGRFTVDLTGCKSSVDCVRVEVDDATVETQNVTSSSDTHWKMYKAGMPKYGHLKLYFNVSDSEVNKDLTDWVKKCGEGKKGDIRKACTVTLNKRDGSAGRSYNFLDLFALNFDPGSFSSTDSGANRSCLTMQIGRITVN